MAHGRLAVYDGKIAGLYDLEETLGSGHFAVVKLARHVFTGEKVAVKVIDKTKLDEVSRAHLFQEVRCMKLVQHPNVVRLYEVIDTQTKLYLILELGDGGDLYDYIMKHDTGLSEQLAREYFRQIVKAIKYCHQLHVVHRDLKPENVVFFEKLGMVKLTDFGFSNKFCPGQKLETSCGSLAYSAPEILLGDSYDAPAVDIWSLGVILFMLVCGQPPFQEANDSETLTMIMDCKYTMPEYISEGCRKLISTMLVREPEKRATLQQIADDEWLNEGASADPAPEYVPLASREQVSEEDHGFIIQKIVNGNIATKDEILEALDRNEYNHITATYFLLAERKLRAVRQEQAQRRKPELSLPVSATGRLSPRSRVQNLQRDLQAALSSGSVDDGTSQLLIPTQTLLNVPRTPGADGIPSGRVRKCSIVQEEEDDEDECSDRDELSNSLNRRGSRSEGRINIAVQDRIAESDRLKKESVCTTSTAASPGSPQMLTKSVAGISGVKILTGENCDPKLRLGGERKPMNLFRRHDVPTIGHVTLCGTAAPSPTSNSFTTTTTTDSPPAKELRSNSIDSHHFGGARSLAADAIVLTKVLTEAATITIPLKGIGALTGNDHADELQFPRYKTMPSPTKNNSILNEIYEEGTDIASSDTSATTTPRPITRHTQFTNVRAQSQGPGQRRTKFNKTRTASCSSSDASDDDSENRKKRAHKIVDSASKRFGQRRDSYDDSSDSQEPGSIVGTGGGGGSTSTEGDNYSGAGTKDSSTTNGGSSNGHISGSGNGKSQQQVVGFRRNRAGRRKAGETRLRESQSLNRITEVQELDISLATNSAAAAAVAAGLASTTHGDSPVECTSPQAPLAQSEITDSRVPSPESPQQVQPEFIAAEEEKKSEKKPKGFSARLLQGFKSRTGGSKQLENELKDPGEIHGDQMSKSMKENLGDQQQQGNNGPTTTTRKLKMLGKYFQVHKKICNIPIPKIFTDRGRLYKAQSCGSIVRDKVNVNPAGGVPAVLTELMVRDGNNNSNNSNKNSNGKPKGRGKIFNRRMKDEQRSNGLLQPMLSGQQRMLGSSEGDINQNLNLSSASSPSLCVDGNNNSNSNDRLEGEGRVNIPIDRRQSSVEPLQRMTLNRGGEGGEDGETQLLLINQVNGVGVEEDFEDIDGSSTEQECDVGPPGDGHGCDGGNSSAVGGATEGTPMSQLPPSTPASLCSSNC